MKIEVGKKYKCGNEVVEIVAAHYKWLIGYTVREYAQPELRGVFFENGDYSVNNVDALSRHLEEIEEPQQNPIIKIEPGKIHPLLFVVLKDENDIYLSTVFLECGSSNLGGILAYYSGVSDEWMFSLKDGLAVESTNAKYNGDLCSFVCIYSDATEAYEAYKKEVESD